MNGKVVMVLALFIIATSICSAEVLILPVTTPDGVWSSPLEAEITYCFTVTGIATNHNGLGFFDAEWQTQPNSDVWEEYDSTWEDLQWDDDNDVMDVYVNDTPMQWLGSSDGINWLPHYYSPSHTYKLFCIGSGNSIKFHIADFVPIQEKYAYGDNDGYLIITIEAISPNIPDYNF